MAWSTRLKRSLALLGLLALAGCETLTRTPVVELVDPATYKPSAAPAAAPAPATGSLFQAASFRPGFEDRRPRMVGDIVIVQIAENISASQSATTTIERSSDVNYAVTDLPVLSAGSSLIGKLGAGATSSNNFEGTGETDANNRFSGSITTTVLDVLPNGHLLVTGEKQIGLNKNVDVLKFSGTVDPRFVQPNGSVSSTQVANVRVESRGRGAQAETQAIGWLARFFLSLMPF
jgi:flagellar L-ring protein precursor FlgH